MSTDMQPSHQEDNGFHFDLLKILGTWRRLIITVTLATTVAVAVIGAVYLLWGQPVRTTSVIEFRPTFDGASRGMYPNGTSFDATDVAAGPIVDIVYDANGIKDYCSREAFRSGFFLERRSMRVTLLDLEYAGRLSDTKLNAVDRERLQAEYMAKRDALPLIFRLTFVHPTVCDGIPRVVVAKALTDVLTTWASESESKRGVLQFQVSVLTPSVLDVGLGKEASSFLRANLARNALLSIVSNVEGVERLPGAGMVRLGAERLGFAEVRSKLTELVQSRVDPLVVTAGQSMTQDAADWLKETTASAERDQQAAQGRAKAYQDALREYSGIAQTAQANRASAVAPNNTNSSDVQTLSPQIDRTFIDRIVEMSQANATFRQDLTKRMVDAAVLAVEAESRAAYYHQLVKTLGQSRRSKPDEASIEKNLDEVVRQGKLLTKQFNDLYAELSRVALRAAAGMYHAETPVSLDVSREFTVRNYLMIVAAAFVGALLLAFGYCLLREWLTAQSSARASA